MNQVFFNFNITILLLFFSILNCKSSNAPEERNPDTDFMQPQFYQGVYISNRMAHSPANLKKLVDELKIAGINTVIVDAQPKKLPEKIVQYFQENKMYAIARVVNFEGGLTSEFPDKERMKSIKETVSYSCKQGFKEINLDYIRYSDGGWNFRAGFEKRYKNITGIISDIRKDTFIDCGQNTLFGADIFGRVPFIENDGIGQRVENFSEVVDLLYPMLYPSHFYGLKSRVADPYNTVLEGLQKTIQRSKPNTSAVAWIQGFQMHIGASGLSYKDYIKVQLQASLDSKSKGFVVWNAMNDYVITLKAFEEFKKENESVLKKLK